MIKYLNFLFIFLSLLLCKANAEIYICDGTNHLNNCHNGKKIIDISNVVSFSGNYINPQIGYFGKKIKEKKKQNNYEAKTGFIGNNFKDLTFKENAKYTPVGYLGNYDFLDFSDLKKITYSGPKILYELNNQDIDDKICKCPKQGVQNIKIKFIRQKLNNKIKLTWDNGDDFDKIKIRRIQPKTTNFEVVGNEFIDDYLEGKSKYYYIVYSYNDCGSFIASDVVYLKIDSENINNSKLILQDNKLIFNNFYETKSSLKCSIQGENFIEKEYLGNFEEKIFNKYKKQNFTCFVEYFDDDGNKNYSNVIINNTFNKKYLINLETIKVIIENSKINKQNYYYLVDFSKESTYNDFAILILNIKSDYTILDEHLGIKIFEQLGFYKQIDDYNKKISFIEIQNILSQLNLINNFNDKVGIEIKKNFVLNKEKLISDLSYIYNLNHYLNDTNDLQIKQCFTLQGCNKIKEYWEIKNIVLSTKNIKVEDLNFIENNYKNYFTSLFNIYLEKHYSNYSSTQKQYFVDILIKSLNIGGFGKEKIDYFSYERMNLFLISGDLQFKLKKLSDYLLEINDVYSKTKDKNYFYNKLLTYLTKN